MHPIGSPAPGALKWRRLYENAVSEAFSGHADVDPTELKKSVWEFAEPPLRLDFTRCQNVSNAVVQALTGELAQAKNVSLNFRNCYRNRLTLTDAAVQALAGGLAEATSVSLDLRTAGT